MEGHTKEFVAASSVPLLLAILAQGESYGYELIRQIEVASGGRITWSEGMLYPVLNKLEHKGIIAAVWRKAETGRERKYYQLTSHGHELLCTERQNWELVSQLIQQFTQPQIT